MARRRIGLAVGMAACFALVGWFALSGLARAAQPAEGASKAPAPKVESWQKEDPPGWEQWNDKRREQWSTSMEHARDAIREHVKVHEQAALRGAEMAARKGVPVSDSEAMARAALDAGLDTSDYDDLAKSAGDSYRQGLKGKALTGAVQTEIDRLKAVRAARAAAKEKPALEKPAADKSAMEKPAAEKPVTKPVTKTDKPATTLPKAME